MPGKDPLKVDQNASEPATYSGSFCNIAEYFPSHFCRKHQSRISFMPLDLPTLKIFDGTMHNRVYEQDLTTSLRISIIRLFTAASFTVTRKECSEVIFP